MVTRLSPREKAAMATQSMAAAAPSPSQQPSEVLSRSNSISIGLGMAGQSGKVKELEKELIDAKSELGRERDTWSGSHPTKRISPKLIHPSKWANRHQDSFSSVEFVDLKDEIQSQGGNVQPIKVRPIVGVEPAEYEIVFGHRRHRACLELGIDVLALVESITDEALFVEMDRENRQRADLRPYEQGLMYKRALDDGLFASQRKAAEKLGVTVSLVSTSIAIAELPKQVLDAFQSPLDIQHRWAAKLNEALSAPDLVIARANDISRERSAGATVTSQEAFGRLCGLQFGSNEKSVHVVKHAGKLAFKVSVSKDKVGIELPALSKNALSKLEKVILESLKEEGVLR